MSAKAIETVFEAMACAGSAQFKRPMAGLILSTIVRRPDAQQRLGLGLQRVGPTW
jgi:hypothetical protein